MARERAKRWFSTDSGVEGGFCRSRVLSDANWLIVTARLRTRRASCGVGPKPSSLSCQYAEELMNGALKRPRMSMLPSAIIEEMSGS